MAAFGLLAAGIAHEVGNPLAALSSLVQMLKRRGPDPYTAEKLDLAARQLQRIERTIRELVDFSRPASTVVTASGSPRWSRRPSASPSTTSAPSSARSRRMSRPTCPLVVGVRDYLTQVVLNLVLNAIDATDDQGRIHVAAAIEGDGLVSERRGRRPRDLAGRPLPAVPAVFHHQAPRHGPGSVRQPADPRGLRGHAFVPLGAGPRVNVSGPAAVRGAGRIAAGRTQRDLDRCRGCRRPGRNEASRSGGASTRDNKAAEPAGVRGRVLIVDDEEVIAATLQEFLQGEGFEVGTARDLPTALRQVETFEPEIVLCDVQLPGADGITVLNRTLQIRPETLFIMITAYATVENAVAAFQRGAQDYLMKPVLFEDLLAKLDRLIALSPAAAGKPGASPPAPRQRGPRRAGRPERRR